MCGIKLVYEHFDHDHFTKLGQVRMSYFDNKPLFMSLKLTTFQISTPGGRPMQISVYRSQNGVRWGRKHPIGRHFVSDIH